MLDQAGLAQKGGAVVSHLRIAQTPEDISAVRIAAGGADLVLGCDLVVAGGTETLPKMRPGVTRAVINAQQTMTGEFTANPDLPFRSDALLSSIRETAGDPDLVDVVDATRIATTLLGDSIATNLFVLGYAWQRGQIPVSAEAIEEAVALNGVAVEMNRQAFLWGRRAAHDPEAVAALIAERAAPEPAGHTISQSLEELIDRRVAFLTDYQNAAYAARYRSLVDQARQAEERVTGGPPAHDDSLTAAVARYGFKLMAYKDEYEVARLYTDGSFAKQVSSRFTGNTTKLQFHLAPPLLSKLDPVTGHPRKMTYGPWIRSAFGILAKLKGLRGTPFDIFGPLGGAQDGTPADRRVFRDRRRAGCRADRGKSAARRRDRLDPGAHPGLWPHQRSIGGQGGASDAWSSLRPSATHRSNRWQRSSGRQSPAVPTDQAAVRTVSPQLR